MLQKKIARKRELQPKCERCGHSVMTHMGGKPHECDSIICICQGFKGDRHKRVVVKEETNEEEIKRQRKKVQSYINDMWR